jgi:hypothetical protein
VKNNRLTLVLNALSKCFLGADLKRRDLSYAGIGEHDIEAIEGFRYLGIEVVQVSHPTDIRSDADCSPPTSRSAASIATRSRPVITTLAPSAAKALAEARPIPLLPPVISAIFPSSRPIRQSPWL